MNMDIADFVQCCGTCQEYHRSQPAETLITSELPTRPWQILGTDLFQYGTDRYLIIVDYYSKFPFLRKMSISYTVQPVVNATKLLFSEHGIPEKIRSDNGRHFDSAFYRQVAKCWGLII